MTNSERPRNERRGWNWRRILPAALIASGLALLISNPTLQNWFKSLFQSQTSDKLPKPSLLDLTTADQISKALWELKNSKGEPANCYVSTDSPSDSPEFGKEEPAINVRNIAGQEDIRRQSEFIPGDVNPVTQALLKFSPFRGSGYRVVEEVPVFETFTAYRLIGQEPAKPFRRLRVAKPGEELYRGQVVRQTLLGIPDPYEGDMGLAALRIKCTDENPALYGFLATEIVHAHALNIAATIQPGEELRIEK